MEFKGIMLMKKLARLFGYHAYLIFTNDNLPMANARALYSIRKGCRHRFNNSYFNAHTESSENWQVEVYEHALQKAREISAIVVFDIGCGSGYKLRKYFSGFKTAGIDLPETVNKLRAAPRASSS